MLPPKNAAKLNKYLSDYNKFLKQSIVLTERIQYVLNEVYFTFFNRRPEDGWMLITEKDYIYPFKEIITPDIFNDECVTVCSVEPFNKKYIQELFDIKEVGQWLFFDSCDFAYIPIEYIFCDKNKDYIWKRDLKKAIEDKDEELKEIRPNAIVY